MKSTRITSLFVLLLFLLVFGLIAQACGPGPYAIHDGQLRDTIFSVEPRYNGSYIVWMTHDDVGSYCVSNPMVAQQATAILHYPAPYNEVVVHYRSINRGDPEWGRLFEPGSGCAADKATTTYLVEGIDLVNGEPPQ